ncbi:hypothetical protein ABZW18_15720 [Streptomyces sp. NPDC004647]|uniref:hypothetical protein n=1 Tax=Streptomyces sp. NPDC004647 TaxID=3154671 RepID=UPI0033AD5FB1
MALDDPHTGPSGSELSKSTKAADARQVTDAALLAGDQLLPCGRPLSRAWEQARDSAPRTDPHTAGCPYCRQAVEGLAALDEATSALRAQERPSGQTLADRVMRAVRAEVRLGRMLPLDDPAQDLRIAETAAARVLRRAADTVSGARAASCRMTPTDDGTAVHISLTLAAALDRPLPDLADQVRRAVLHAAHRVLGLAVTGVDLEIVDVLEPLQPPDPGEADDQEAGVRVAGDQEADVQEGEDR